MAIAAFKVHCILRSVLWEKLGQETNLFVWLPQGTFLPIVHHFSSRQDICNRLGPPNDDFLLKWLFELSNLPATLKAYHHLSFGR